MSVDLSAVKGKQILCFVADKFALQSVGELHLRLTVLLKGGFYEKPRRFSTDVIKGRLHLKYFLSCGNSSILSNRMLLDYPGHVLKKRPFFVGRKNCAKGTQKIWTSLLWRVKDFLNKTYSATAMFFDGRFCISLFNYSFE